MPDTTSHDHGSSNGNGVAALAAGDLGEALRALVDCASQPLDHARALPASLYKDEAIYELELERIWRSSWLYAGRVEELERPGDWLRFEVAGEPVVVTRARDGEINALSRICPHRFMDVLGLVEEERGNADSFVCPYHSWAFDLDGSLAGAPLMERSARFGEERDGYCLARYRTSVWNGFVFVNLDPDAPPLAATFDQLDPLLGNYRLDEWRKVTRVAWGDSPVNWKLALDNGREGYHHQGLHKESLEPLWPAHMIEMEPTEALDFFMARMFVSPEAAIGQEDGHYINPTLLPPAPGLTSYERSHYLVIGVYPGFILIPGPDMTLVQTFTPTGPMTHDMNFDILFHESALERDDWEQIRDEAREWVLQIQREDSAALVALQEAICKTRLDIPGGALSHLERPMWSIQRFLAHRLTGADLNVGVN